MIEPKRVSMPKTKGIRIEAPGSWVTAPEDGGQVVTVEYSLGPDDDELVWRRIRDRSDPHGTWDYACISIHDRLEQARCAICWATTKGFGELAETGPTAKSKIGAPVTLEAIHSITAVVAVTETAWRAWCSAS